MDKVLAAVDEFTGLITACALVRPSRSLGDLTAKSVKGKWKDKAFAAGVDRAEIEAHVRALGVDLTASTSRTRSRPCARWRPRLGLDGSLATPQAS